MLFTQADAGQDLLYSLSSGDSMPFPRIAKTEILAVAPETGNRRVAFPDIGLDWPCCPHD
jgi:hypothetical protein